MKSKQNSRDLTGASFHYWTVLYLDTEPYKYGKRWLCRCQCGTQRAVSQNGLLAGSSKSCGCWTIQRSNENFKVDSPARKLYCAYRSNSIRKHRDFVLTFEQFKYLTSRPCHYCGTEFSCTKRKAGVLGEDYKYNGIDRIDNKQGYIIDNCLPCCHRCNRAKGTDSYENFIQWIISIRCSSTVSEKQIAALIAKEIFHDHEEE